MLRDGYRAANDTLQRSFLANKALTAYQSAVDLDPENLDAQTGLGTVTVEGGGAPMTGIQILLGVVEKDPENAARSEEHQSELQSLMRISYAVFCLNKKKTYTK